METKNKKSIIEELKSELTDLEKQLEKTGDGMKENYKKKKAYRQSDPKNMHAELRKRVKKKFMS